MEKNKKLIFLVEGKKDELFLKALCNRLELNKEYYTIAKINMGNNDGITNIPFRLEYYLNNQYSNYVMIIDSDNDLQKNLNLLDKGFKDKNITLNLIQEIKDNAYSKHNIKFDHNEETCTLDFFAFHDNTTSNPCKGTYEALLFESINNENPYKKLVLNTFENVNKIYKNSQINTDLIDKINNINNIYKRKISIYLSLHHKCYEKNTNGIYNPFAIYESPKTFDSVYGDIFQPLEEYENFIQTSYDNFLNH